MLNDPFSFMLIPVNRKMNSLLEHIAQCKMQLASQHGGAEGVARYCHLYMEYGLINWCLETGDSEVIVIQVILGICTFYFHCTVECVGFILHIEDYQFREKKWTWLSIRSAKNSVSASV